MYTSEDRIGSHGPGLSIKYEVQCVSTKEVARPRRDAWLPGMTVWRQGMLEESLGGFAGVPALAAISGDKGRFATMREVGYCSTALV